jgi:hypothetical protein
MKSKYYIIVVKTFGKFIFSQHQDYQSAETQHWLILQQKLVELLLQSQTIRTEAKTMMLYIQLLMTGQVLRYRRKTVARNHTSHSP